MDAVSQPAAKSKNAKKHVRRAAKAAKRAQQRAENSEQLPPGAARAGRVVGAGAWGSSGRWPGEPSSPARAWETPAAGGGPECAQLGRTLSSESYDKMLANPKLTRAQRAQFVKMRSKRAAKENAKGKIHRVDPKFAS